MTDDITQIRVGDVVRHTEYRTFGRGIVKSTGKNSVGESMVEVHWVKHDFGRYYATSLERVAAGAPLVDEDYRRAAMRLHGIARSSVDKAKIHYDTPNIATLTMLRGRVIHISDAEARVYRPLKGES